MANGKQSPYQVSAADVLLSAHVDSALRFLGVPYESGYLRAILNFYALFYEHVVITDTPLLHDWLLQDMLLPGSGYDRFFDIGVLVPAMRDSVRSFTELEAETRHRGTFRVPDPLQRRNMSISDYAGFLDDKMRAMPQLPLIYQTKMMENGFTHMIEDFLLRLEVTKELQVKTVLAKSLKALRDRHPEQTSYNRSEFYEYAQFLEPQHPLAARRLREFVSTLYHANAATVLNLEPAYPNQLRVAANAIHRVQVPDLGAPQKDLSATIATQLQISLDDFTHVSLDFIADMRKSQPFQDYITLLRRTGSDTVQGQVLYETLLTYLRSMEEPLREDVAHLYSTIQVLKQRKKRISHLFLHGGTMISLVGLGLGLINPVLGMVATIGGCVWAYGGVRADSRAREQIEQYEQAARVNPHVLNNHRVAGEK